jgi:hypothetical protein
VSHQSKSAEEVRAVSEVFTAYKTAGRIPAESFFDGLHRLFTTPSEEAP